MVPDGVRPPGPSSGLEAVKGQKFFWAQTVLFDHSIYPWWSLTVFGPPGPSSGLEAVKGWLRPKFFLPQMVPCDLSVDS